MDTGDIYKTNFCGDIEVINYINNKNVRIKFIESGHMKYTTSRCIRLGEVKDPYSKTVFGVGYLGEGSGLRFTPKGVQSLRTNNSKSKAVIFDEIAAEFGIEDWED